jgi:tRNA A-37 threonylcarbamoyl transferase component Bud32
MKSFSNKGIEWFTDDESLVFLVKEVDIPEGGRRGYVKTECRGRKVFIKSFVEKGLPGFIRNRVASRGKREYDLGMRLLSASIPTPRPLGYGVSRMGSYIIQELVEGDTFIAAYNRTENRVDLLTRLAFLLKKMKIHHARHNDLHLENILLVNNEFYLVDLHKMRIKHSFTVQDEASNLSHALVGIYGDLNDEERESFFAHYGTPRIREVVEQEMERLSARWVRRKKERAFRETSMILRRDNRFYLAGMEGYGTGAFAGLIKKDRKVRIERYTDHIRKIYRNKRRLERAWRAHVVLAYMGLGIVPRVFYVEMPHGVAQGHIAMEDLKGTGEELDRYLDRRYGSMSENQRRRLEDKLSGYFLMLTRKKIVHKDVKACNVFVPTDGDFMLLDVEDVKFQALDEQALKRMLVQLNTTIPKGVGTRARIRFFVKFTSAMKVDRRVIFSSIVKESLKREIVYEGVNGLVRETW